MSSKPAGAARSPRKRWGIAALVAVALTLVLGVGTAWAEATFAKADYRWYTDNPDATEFVITTGPQMQGLANLVNGSVGEDEGIAVDGPIDFAGKTVSLGTSVNLGNLFGTREFTPIGTDEHPFQGIFDGAGNTVKGMRITSEQGLTKDIGMFGVVGDAGLIRNVNMEDSCLVEIASVEQDNRIEDVGAIVGENRGSMENCTSAAHINVMYTPEECTGKVIRNIGGLAGSVQGTVTGCSFSGQLRADTPVNAYEENNESVAYVAENFGGVVGYIYGDLSSSSNSGNLIIVTSGQSGVDRFGSKVEAKAEYIGGVAGYCMSNVDDCHNVANIFATSKAGALLKDMNCDRNSEDQSVFKADGGGNGVGGVVGSLRGIAKSGMGDSRSDPGVDAEADDADKHVGVHITMSNCTNTGYISGLHTVGGVVGTAGSYTLVTRCSNGVAGEDPSSNVGHVRTTRWNKPGCGGVVGQSWGQTSYCRNHGTVENTRSGYYSAGVVGMIEMHDFDGKPQQTEKPEVWGCYNTGIIFCDGGNATFREGGIVGQNNGYVHDNVFLWGTVSTNTSSSDGNQLAIGGQYGTEANNVVMYGTKAQADKNEGYLITSGEAVAVLNKTAESEGWKDYYFITSTTNNGYPVLNGEGRADSQIDLSKVACRLTFVKNASYTTAFNPIPKVKVTVTINGETKQLVQDSDFKVIPDPEALGEDGFCKGLTNGKQPYRAKIVGIGNYIGESVSTVSYGIDKGDFSECRVLVQSETYTGEPKNTPQIQVLDIGGNVIESDQYETPVVNDGEDCIDASDHYPVSVTAKASGNYSGTARGTYRIERVDIYRDADIIGLEYDNRVWYYDETATALYEVIPAHADGTPIEEGEELEYYNLEIGKDENGEPIYAMGSDGEIAKIPYVMKPADFEDDQALVDESQRKYKVNGSFCTYQSSEGRTLTIAEPKKKTAQGTPVYGDMSVDFTGSQIRPKVIGALLDGRWLKGTEMRGTGSSLVDTTAAWCAVYGGTSDGSEFARPRNTNITTSESTPEASVVVRGNSPMGYSNLTYMDFRIRPIKVAQENIKLYVKDSALLVTDGSLPVLPGNKKQSTGDYLYENEAFEVRYAPDPNLYDPENQETYRVLDVANWTIDFDHAVASDEMTPIDQDSKDGFVVGAQVYCRIAPMANCSVKGWDSFVAEEPLVISAGDQSKVDLGSSDIVIETKTVPYNPTDPLAGLTVTDVANNKVLLKGESSTSKRKNSYVLKAPKDADGNIDNDKPVELEVDPDTGELYIEFCITPYVANPKNSNYVGSSANYRLTYTKTDYNPAWSNWGNTRPPQFVLIGKGIEGDSINPASLASASIATDAIPYRPEGWTKTELSELLTLEWNPTALVKGVDFNIGRQYQRMLERGFKIESIKDSQGNEVEKIEGVDAIGQTYSFTVSGTPETLTYFTGMGEGTIQRGPAMQFKMVLPNLPGILGSQNGVTTIYERIECDHEYMYTGNPVDLNLHLYDVHGNDYGEYLTVLKPEKGFTDADDCINAGAHNEPDYSVGSAQGGLIKGTYRDIWVTGDGVHIAKTTINNNQAASSINRIRDDVDLSFTITPADISDPSKVRIEIDQAESYLQNGGQAVTPTVRFYDAQTGERLNFHEGVGNDYTVEYLNNTHVASKDDPQPPTAVIRLQGNNLSVGGATSVGTTYEVPFDIIGDGTDVAEMDWDYASIIALRADGTLNQPGVIPSDTSLRYTALGALPDFAVAAGTLDADGSFQEKNEGWKEGNDVYLQVKGVKKGVLTGVVVLGPIKVAENDEGLHVAASDTVFTAHAAVPKLTVSCGGDTLKEGRDYSWTCSNVNAGSATVSVQGLGAYAGKGIGEFVIHPASLLDEGLEVTAPSKDYTGRTVMLDADDVAKMTVTFNGVPLDASDWAVQNVNEDGTTNVNAGTGVARLVPGASSNFADGTSREIEFDIEPIALKNEELEITAGSLPYNGGEVVYDDAAAGLAIYDKVRDQSLLYGRDFTIAGYSNNVGVGAATVYLAGAGNYSATKNTVTAEFEITPINFSTAQISIPEPGWYDWQGKGNPVKPVPIVTFGGNVLDPSQYTVSYGSNDAVTELAADGSIVGDAGTLTVTPVAGNKNFTGESVTLSFAIVADLSRATVGVVADQEYDPTGAYAPDLDVHFNGVALEKGVHYEVIDETDENAVGLKMLTIRGIGSCAGSRTFTFSVLGKAITDDMVTVDDSGLVYNGKALVPVVTVKDGDYVLEEGKDYICNYAANIGATSTSSHPTVEITGIGNYALSVAREFNIAPASLENAKLTLGEAPIFIGNPVTVPVTVQLADGTQLREGTDFSVAYDGNDRAGQASVRVTGIGNYQGTLEGAFALKGNLAGATVQPIAAVTYNGSPQVPALTVTMGPVTLGAGTDYRVEYSSNVEPGTALVRVVGIGSYEGVTYASFTVKPQPSSVAPDPSHGVVNNYYYYTTNNTTNNGGTTNNATNNTANNGGATTNTTTTSGGATVAPTPQGPTTSVASEGAESAPAVAYGNETISADSGQPAAQEVSDDAAPLAAGGADAGSSEAQDSSTGNLFVQSPWFIIMILLGVGLIVFLASLRYRKRNSE